MKLFEAGLRHVRVDLRCGNVRVAQHDLDGPKVRVVLHEMSGERVAKRVR